MDKFNKKVRIVACVVSLVFHQDLAWVFHLYKFKEV